MPWRLLVIDGADTNRFCPIPESGTVLIGNSRKHADFHLNDLYVGRVHCEIHAEGDRIRVQADDPTKETLVNGIKVEESELAPGDVIRVGNSFLRLEATEPEPEPEIEEVGDVEVLEVSEEYDDAEAVEEVHVMDPLEPPLLEWDELDQLTGLQLGHFKVGEMLGRGFHGAVFRAVDLETRRDVALKVIAPAFPANKDELQRFARVIKDVAKLHEEHLVRWTAAGRTGPYCWISQELIEGESLAQILQKEEPITKVTWRNAMKMAIDLAKALDPLFKRRIVHGNVVPANVVIRMSDRTVKLNDLMFVEALKDSVWYKDRLQGKLLAELPYLPPERAIPGGYWDGLADIYSLGAVVYARLTGRPPVQGATAGETIERIQKGKIEPPQKFVKDMPDAFQTVVMKMLANSQEDRYQTPERLLQDLNRVYTIP
jgi:hypothetical protein